jgi:hypothetical protein
MSMIERKIQSKENHKSTLFKIFLKFESLDGYSFVNMNKIIIILAVQALLILNYIVSALCVSILLVMMESIEITINRLIWNYVQYQQNDSVDLFLQNKIKSEVKFTIIPFKYDEFGVLSTVITIIPLGISDIISKALSDSRYWIINCILIFYIVELFRVRSFVLRIFSLIVGMDVRNYKMASNPKLSLQTSSDLRKLIDDYRKLYKGENVSIQVRETI